MQLDDVSFKEAEHDYLQGLKPEIRKSIRATDSFKDITELQNACLKLDIREKGNQGWQEEVLHTETKHHRGAINFRGNYRSNHRGRTIHGRGNTSQYHPYARSHGQNNNFRSDRGYKRNHRGHSDRMRFEEKN